MSRKKEPTFEEQMEELNRLVDEVGREDCPLDELESKVRRSAGLIRDLRARLASTEMSVREVLEELTAGGRGSRDASTPGDDDEGDDEEPEDEPDDED
jgi:exodeoxyribonuclease VII small subunit